MKTLNVFLISAAAAVALILPASAQQLKFQFVSPTFGGNGLNGTFLLQGAQAQGFGPKGGSQQNSPNLTGLTNALGNLNLGNTSPNNAVASPIIIIGSPTVPAVP
jgi:curli production assembly/transport component CsgF